MTLRIAASAAAAVGALCVGLGAASPANAALVLTDLECTVNDIDPAATACAGWFEGNLLNASNIDEQIEALDQIGFTWDGDWDEVDATKVDAVGDDFDFATLLSGVTYIGIHKGKGGQDGVEGTAFFRLEADDVDIVTLLLSGASSAVFYTTGGDGGGGGNEIPEPGTWALMLLGFGSAGAMLRRRRAYLARAA